MGKWTWLFTKFPLADIELMSEPMDPKIANVLVRTISAVSENTGETQYDVRVAPHNVAPFRGGPWIRRFSQSELEHPGTAIAKFRTELLEAIRQLRQ